MFIKRYELLWDSRNDWFKYWAWLRQATSPLYCVDNTRNVDRNLPIENGMTDGREAVRTTKQTKTLDIVWAMRAKMVKVAIAVRGEAIVPTATPTKPHR